MLPEQSRPRRSEREPDCRLALPAHAARQQKVRHVDAHHQENDPDQAHQNPERVGIRTVEPLDTMPAWLGEQLGDRAGFDLDAFRNRHGPELGSDLRRRHRLGDVRVDARHLADPPVAVVLPSRAVRPPVWLKSHFDRQRGEDVGPLAGSEAEEARRCDADHVRGYGVDAHDSIDRIGETAHVVHPVSMTHNHHRVAAHAILVVPEWPAADRHDTQPLEEVAADVLDVDLFRRRSLRRDRDRVRLRAKSNQRTKGGLFAGQAPVQIRRDRCAPVLAGSDGPELAVDVVSAWREPDVRPSDETQRIGVAHGKRSQERGVDETEDRRVRIRCRSSARERPLRSGPGSGEAVATRCGHPEESNRATRGCPPHASPRECASRCRDAAGLRAGSARRRRPCRDGTAALRRCRHHAGLCGRSAPAWTTPP